MATQMSSVITDYCAIYVDDINMSELAFTDPPLYFRNMWQLLKPALSKFTHPEQMQDYLFKGMTEPSYDSMAYVTVTDYTEDFMLPLGDNYKGYDLAAVRLKSSDRTGAVVMIPLLSEYNSEIGYITIALPNGEPLPAGTVLDFDFYKDGQFAKTLTPQMMNIIGYCFQYVWQDRFNTDWVSIVSKIEDKSFQEQNRANKMNSDTMRLREIGAKLFGAMRKFEQDVMFRNALPNGGGIVI